jgi:hypothetical protein
MVLDGSLSNLQLHDLTNYPNTLIQNDVDNIKPKELFGIAKSGNDENQRSLIKLEFKMINPQFSYVPEDFHTNELTVKIDSIRIDYYQQVILRLINYITEQLLGAVSKPSDDADADLHKSLSAKQNQLNSNEKLTLMH